MAGLLDFFQTPAGQGLLAAGFSAAANAGRGGPWNTLGKAGMNGLLGYTGAQQQAQDAELRGMQLQNMKSEIATREEKLRQSKENEAQIRSILTPQPQPGQMGSGTFDIQPTAPGVPAIPQAGGARVPNLSFDQLAMLKRRGLDLVDLHKYANDPRKLESGSTYENRVTGQREYMPDPTKGLTFQNGRVSLLPGFTDAQTQLTLAQEAPKTLLSSAGRVNLRANPDGTQSPVSELSENTTLQGVLGNIFGRPAAPPTPAGGAPALPAPGRPTVSPADQKGADAESIRMIQAELQNPNLPAAHRAGMEREVARLTQSQSASGFPAPSLIQNPQTAKYGKTTAQETGEAVDKEAAILQVKDIGEQRKSIMNAGFVAPSNIAKYQQIGKLLADVDGGKWTPAGTEFASTLNGLGIKIDKNLSNKEAAASLANEAALQLRSPSGGAGMPGALSDSDRNFLTSMTPNMAQSAQGRKVVIDSYVAVQQRNQQVAQFARNYEKKHGRLDNGFFDQLQAWSNSNPLFKGK